LNAAAAASIERIGAIKKLHLQDQCSSTVVEHLSRHPNVQGLNPEATASTRRGEWYNKACSRITVVEHLSIIPRFRI
jgi:hypothetical protein